MPEPYFNEPGYNGEPFNGASKRYNMRTLINNLKHAILEQIRKPPSGFEEVVRSHFFHRRDSLIKDLEKYIIKFFDPNQNKNILRNTDEELTNQESSLISKNKILNPMEIRNISSEEEKMLKHFLSEVKQALLNI